MELTPIYRIEYFLDAIVNGSVCPYDPIYRVEYYLAQLAGADVTIPEPIYRVEFYLAKLCGMDVEIPDPIYRIEFYLAKACGMDVEVPEPIYRVEYWLYEMAGGGTDTYTTFTGSLIQFTAPKAHAFKSFSFTVDPVQSGSGDPSPDNERPISGWNSANLYRTAEYDPTASPSLTLNFPSTVYGGNAVWNGDGTWTVTVDRVFFEFDGSADEKWQLGATGVRQAFLMRTGINKAATASAITGLMTNSIKISTTSETTSAEDSNITWRSTNYESDRVYVFTPISQISTVAEFKAYLSTSPLQVVYPLATPQTITVTTETLFNALKGENNIWTDTGDTTLEAIGEAIELNALQSLNILLGGRYVNNHTADDVSDEEALNIILGGNNT